MRAKGLYKIFMMTAIVLAFAACKSSKNVETTVPSSDVVTGMEFLQKVSDNAQYSKFITSKIKFQVQVGAQDVSLTGNLKMKKDDVIMLQLMAFGFVEAGRIELTEDYVLIMDRINKQYLKVPYNQLSFMRNTGLNFYSLQALFWNEFFLPGEKAVTDKLLKNYETEVLDEKSTVISYEQDKMSYKWLAEQVSGLITMANIMYKDRFRGNTQLNWDYEAFKVNGTKAFPTNNTITFTTDDKEIKINLILNYIKNDSDWDTRTEVPAKYRQVELDDILRRLMSM